MRKLWKKFGNDQGICCYCNENTTATVPKSYDFQGGSVTKISVLKTGKGKSILKYAIIGFFMSLPAAMSGINYSFMFPLLMPIWINVLCWGWRSLNKITSSIFLFLPIIGWLIYFGIKGAAAMIVGWYAFPKAIFEAIREARG